MRATLGRIVRAMYPHRNVSRGGTAEAARCQNVSVRSSSTGAATAVGPLPESAASSSSARRCSFGRRTGSRLSTTNVALAALSACAAEVGP